MKKIFPIFFKISKWILVLVVGLLAALGAVTLAFATVMFLSDYSGYPQFQYWEGKSWYRSKDYYRAVKYFTKAANEGHLQAQLDLAKIYDDGIERKPERIDQDSQAALKWYRMAADQGHAEAQFKCASMMVQSADFNIKQYPEVAQYYRKAADQGHARAQAALAMLYVAGLGVPRDIVEAGYWFRRFKLDAKSYDFEPDYLQWIDEVTSRISRDLSPQQLKLIEERIQQRPSRP
jgi:tetratricopeptide (TPR) repeat protein